MFWFGIYLVVASVVAPTVFVAGRQLTKGSPHAAEHPGLIAALAGLSWPVLLVGLTELLLVDRAANGFRHAGSSHTTSPGPLSGRSPRQLGWRSLPSEVISP